MSAAVSPLPPRTAGVTTSAPVSIGAQAPAPSSVLLAGQHFAASILYLLAGAVGLVWIAPELAMGTYPSPRVAGITHLFTLGWLTTTIFGALYQLLPVALGAPVYSEPMGHASPFERQNVIVSASFTSSAGVVSSAIAALKMRAPSM